MRVTKAALLAAIEQAFTKYDTEKADWDKAADIWRTQQAKRWVERKQPQWKALRDLISASIKAKKPITTDEVNSVLFNDRSGYRSSYLSDHTFNPTQDPPTTITLDGVQMRQPVGIPRGQLEALKAFLESSPDESFTMEALARLGFKAPAFVFRAAVGAADEPVQKERRYR